jgi:hypothetical protein
MKETENNWKINIKPTLILTAALLCVLSPISHAKPFPSSRPNP